LTQSSPRAVPARSCRLDELRDPLERRFDSGRPVAAYFAAEKAADPDALARCFVEEVVVRDEGYI
jgi:hypothetical protein